MSEGTNFRAFCHQQGFYHTIQELQSQPSLWSSKTPMLLTCLTSYMGYWLPQKSSVEGPAIQKHVFYCHFFQQIMHRARGHKICCILPSLLFGISECFFRITISLLDSMVRYEHRLYSQTCSKGAKKQQRDIRRNVKNWWVMRGYNSPRFSMAFRSSLKLQQLWTPRECPHLAGSSTRELNLTQHFEFPRSTGGFCTAKVGSTNWLGAAQMG